MTPPVKYIIEGGVIFFHPNNLAQPARVVKIFLIYSGEGAELTDLNQCST